MIRKVFCMTVMMCLFCAPVFASGQLSDALFYSQITTNTEPIVVYQVKQQKQPWASCLVSVLIPGLGQMYNEQYAKSVAYFGGYVIGLSLAIAAVEDDFYFYGRYVDADGDNQHGMVGLIVATCMYVGSVIDAPISSIRINKQNQNNAIGIQSIFDSNKTGALVIFRW